MKFIQKILMWADIIRRLGLRNVAYVALVSFQHAVRLPETVVSPKGF